MEVDQPEICGDQKGFEDNAVEISCSICLDAVVDRGERSIAKLQCGHQFHLDCIGSAFNVKGAMQCPNCRKVEKGKWVCPYGNRPSSEFNIEDSTHEDLYSLSFTEMPSGFYWCPHQGYMQLSLYEEGASPTFSYQDIPGGSAMGDYQNASSSSDMCPYLALPGLPHAIDHAAYGALEYSVNFSSHYHHPFGIEVSADGEQAYSQISNGNPLYNWQYPSVYPLPYGIAIDQPVPPLASRPNRHERDGSQRTESNPFFQGSNGHNSTPAVLSSAVGDSLGHTHFGSHQMFYPQASSFTRNAQLRRTIPRGWALSSSPARSSVSDAGQIYSSTTAADATTSRNRPETESNSRHYNRHYRWVRDAFVPTPWFSSDGGEAPWWPHFQPSHHRSQWNFLPQRFSAEGPLQCAWRSLNINSSMLGT